nr:AraC family transcriptional regulator [uncultured Cupriavidus sp.]
MPPTRTTPAPKTKPAPVDAFGCAADKLNADQSLAGTDIQFYRKSSRQPSGQIEMPAAERGFVAGVSLNPGHRRRIFRGRHGSTHDFDNGAIYLRSLSEDYKADFDTAFDFILMELPPGFIERTSVELGRTRVRSLQEVAGHTDPVLANLAQAMAPALSHPEYACRLFVDQLGMAIGAHLVRQYGAEPEVSSKGNRLLSPRNVARAKDLLSARMDGDLSIAEVADACQLSRSHFTRAFRDTTGQTPYQWLMAQRLERARALLRDTALPLAEVAIACGFSDQSHFTRTFARVMGMAPGVWRRRCT